MIIFGILSKLSLALAKSSSEASNSPPGPVFTPSTLPRSLSPLKAFKVNPSKLLNCIFFNLIIKLTSSNYYSKQ